MNYINWGLEVIDGEIEALKVMREKIGGAFESAVGFVRDCGGKVIISGLGKSGHAGRKISATMSSLGIPSVFLHSSEALHGDSGIIGEKDVVIVISNSGETSEVVQVAGIAKERAWKTIAMTGKADSSLAKLADVTLDIGVEREADHLNLAPTSSAITTIAMGDAVAVAVARSKNFTSEDFGRFHSGGSLGKKILS